MKSSNKLYAFGCDFSPDTGEGFLANAILSHVQRTNDVVVYGDPVVRLLRRRPLSRDRLLPLYLFVVILGYLARNRRVLLLNYAAIWNFLNAALVRFGASLGPITGSVFIVPRSARLRDRVLRLYIQRILVGAFLRLYPRGRLVWAATPSVMAQFERAQMPRLTFGFPFAVHVVARNCADKKFDIFIYSGHHPIKNHSAALAAVSTLASANYKVCYVGPDFVGNGLSVTAFFNLPEALFNQYLGESRLYISFSFEDAGITGMKALAFGVPILCPARSGLAYMTAYDAEFCYDDPDALDDICDKAGHILSRPQDYSTRAALYFSRARSATAQSIEIWSNDL